MIERRGPEYVRPEVWQAAQARRQRRVRLTMIPVVLVVISVTFASLTLPQRIAKRALEEMVAAARLESGFHAIERRAGDVAGILRDEYVQGEARRSTMFDGEVDLVMAARGEAFAIERTPSVSRKHLGSLVSVDVVGRLLQDCEKPRSIRFGEGGRLEITTRDKKYEITLDSKKRPIAWLTSYRNEITYVPLWETTVEYGKVNPKNFEPTHQAVTQTDHVDPGSPIFTQEIVLDAIGDIEVMANNANRLGDLVLVLNGRYERPFVEVEDGNGNRLSSHTLQSTLWRDRRRYRTEVMAIQLQSDPVVWPRTFKVRVRNYDPRFKVEGFPNRVVGEKTFTFSKPTCSTTPPYWFGRVMSDQGYFDYLSTRAYRLATVFQNAMRTKDGRVVDTMTGGAVGFAEADLIRSPMDTVRAIDEMRQVLRLKAEFDNNAIPMSQLYAQLATLYLAAGYRDQARAAVEFVQERNRYTRIDGSILAEIERISKELEAQ